VWIAIRNPDFIHQDLEISTVPVSARITSVVDPHWFQCGSGSESGSWSDFKVQKVEFLHEKYAYSSYRSKNIPTKIQKPF
jgi:hypothetical protein